MSDYPAYYITASGPDDTQWDIEIRMVAGGEGGPLTTYPTPEDVIDAFATALTGATTVTAAKREVVYTAL